MDVSTLMTRDVVTIGPSTPVKQAIQMLEDLMIRHLPVVDDGRLVGVLSDRDLREYRLPLMEEVENPDMADDMLETPVSELMSGDLLTLDSGEGVRTAIDLMVEHHVGALPVVDRHSDELVGILSYVDILKALRTSLD